MGFIDWQLFMQEQLEGKKVEKLLELGLGEGTKFLLTLSPKVYSIELACLPEHHEWFDRIENELRGEEGWKPYLYECEDKYEVRVKTYVSGQLGRIKPDVVFVDPGVHFRGDLVNLMMEKKVKYIFAHDTKQGFDDESGDIYGWNKIEGKGYKRTDHEDGEGTTLWERF